MSQLTAKDIKAIGWYATEYQLKPMLSAPPTIYFRTINGEQVAYNLSTIISEYDNWNEQDKKERARTRAAERVRRPRV